MDAVGADVESLAKEWRDELKDLEMADDWEVVQPETFMDQSRWCTHWQKTVQHTGGLAIQFEYAKNTGDGESADTFPTTWREVTLQEKTVVVKEFVLVDGGRGGELESSF